jgi:hypothetical protein
MKIQILIFKWSKFNYFFGKISCGFKMNLNKISDKDKLELCKKYYIAGFFFLPFVWIVNFFWFFGHAFKRPVFPEQAEMRKCNRFIYIY